MTDSKRSILEQELNKINAKGYGSADRTSFIVSFILAREQAMLSEIEKPLKEVQPVAKQWGRYDDLWNAQCEALATITRMRGGEMITMKAVTSSRLPRWWITMVITIALWLFDSVNLKVVGFEPEDEG